MRHWRQIYPFAGPNALGRARSTPAAGLELKARHSRYGPAPERPRSRRLFMSRARNDRASRDVAVETGRSPGRRLRAGHRPGPAGDASRRSASPSRDASSTPPVFTVEQSKALRGELDGAHIKNLFLRNKKGRMWLVTCLEDRAGRLEGAGRALCRAGRFSFGSAERLMKYLGVMPGAVTPFARPQRQSQAPGARSSLTSALAGSRAGQLPPPGQHHAPRPFRPTGFGAVPGRPNRPSAPTARFRDATLRVGKLGRHLGRIRGPGPGCRTSRAIGLPERAGKACHVCVSTDVWLSRGHSQGLTAGQVRASWTTIIGSDGAGQAGNGGPPPADLIKDVQHREL